MTIDIRVWLTIAAVLLALDIIIIIRLVWRKFERNRRRILLKKETDRVMRAAWGSEDKNPEKVRMANYFQLKQSISLDKVKTDSVERIMEVRKAEGSYLRRVHSPLKTRRIEAVVYLGLIGSEAARLKLEQALLREKDMTVKLYIANALSDIGNRASLPMLVASLIGLPRFYRTKVNMLIADFGEHFDQYLPQILQNEKIEIRELIVDFASVFFSERTKNYLVSLVDSREKGLERAQLLYIGGTDRSCSACLNGACLSDGKSMLCTFKGEMENPGVCNDFRTGADSRKVAQYYRDLVLKACDTLGQYYPDVLDSQKYLQSEDEGIRSIAVRSLGQNPKNDPLEKLLPFLADEATAISAVIALSQVMERNPSYLKMVSHAFRVEKDMRVRKELARVLSGKIEYFIMKLTHTNRGTSEEIIEDILSLGRSSETIDFLNRNRDLEMENALLPIIRRVVAQKPSLEKDYASYLSSRLVTKCGFASVRETVVEEKGEKDRNLVRPLVGLLVFTILVFPAIYLYRNSGLIGKVTLSGHLRQYIRDFNYYIAFYALTISVIYLGLLLLSHISSRRQLRLWRVKNLSLLFKRRILPSVSIIAPAYNEEKTIIESTNALLNLRYPDYELILVNDGSKDRTLEVLVRNFSLKRVDHAFEEKLKTKAVRGVYRNPSLPRLTVVDKANGGKADSLNTGINLSDKEYFCGIDADSILEDDALLKLASLTLDQSVETPALGGNIFPINGCQVEMGQISRIGITKNNVARFQTVEYIRAFMAGRLGWASMNSLLIISGAFGLFRKERVVEAGGYLTQSGRYSRDTVGEDMELVVRITREMREKKLPFRVCYGLNANCWTEVPEDLRSLRKQRHRWHRGLVETLSFHKKMLFNPGYGRTGLVAMPYFFIFELMGPLVEVQGYLMVLLAVLFGLLNMEIALLLFVSTILMGVLISLASLAIAEEDRMYFTFRDTVTLILYGILENFGPRQLISVWRVSGYLKILKKPAAWDKGERKGFSALRPGSETAT